MKKKIIIFLILVVLVLLALAVGFELYVNKQLIVTVCSTKLEHVNEERYEDYLVQYTYDFERNEFGYEVLVEKDTNYVIDCDVWVEITDDTYVISGHGDAADFLRNVDVGDIIDIQDDTLTVERNLYLSNLKKIEIENSKIDDIINQRSLGLYDIDIDNISIINEQIDAAINDFEECFLTLDIDEEQINGKVDAILELIHLKYYQSFESNAVGGRGMWHRPNASGID